MKTLLITLLSIAFSLSALSSTLYGVSNAYVDCVQEKEWDSLDGNFIQLIVEANVDPYNSGTFSKIVLIDSLTGDSTGVYLPSSWTGLSADIPTITYAESYFAQWLTNHLVNYTDPVISGWVELDIADEPDFFSWGYINDDENGPIDTSLDWWVDWDAAGPRFSNSRPADFGRYLWDGSINPSWTAAKKGFAKGHNKQPLPTTK